jgi:uroporphyrinogen decarboxylase
MIQKIYFLDFLIFIHYNKDEFMNREVCKMGNIMSGRERVRAVLDKKIPDRVPCGLGGCETTGLHLLAYKKLNDLLGLTNAVPRLDTFMTNAVFEKETIYKMGGDMILLASPRMCGAQLWQDDKNTSVDDLWKKQVLWGNEFLVAKRERFETLPDGTVVWNNNNICPPGTLYFDSPSPSDLYADFDIPDPADFKPSHSLDEKLLRSLENTARILYEETDLSIVCGETITDLQVQPGGLVGLSVLITQEPDVMHEILDKYVESALAQLKELDQAIGKYVDILSIAHDFGDNRGITIGDDNWRKIYKQHYYKLFHGWHEITNMKINLHSCGSIDTIMNDLIDCEVDIINPVQASAKDMDLHILKEKYGGKIIFYGGAYDPQLINYNKSYDEVYCIVRENIRVLAENGGYIMSGVHNLPGDMPSEHLRALLDAFNDVKE